MSERTEDRLLGGRVRLLQPRVGLRAGLDAVMLAARVPARPGEQVLELGCGSGAATLCLLARVRGLRAVALERDLALAALAAENAGLNGWGEAVAVRVADLTRPEALDGLPRCDHGLANPPYWNTGTTPPAAIRAAATHAEAEVPLLAWTAALARKLRRGGTATLVLPAARHGEGWAALREAGFGAVSTLPLWPRAGMAAKRVLLDGRLGARGPDRLLPGLVLHAGQGWTAAATAILRDGASLGDAGLDGAAS
ncbi:tRNA1(Val) (adenine(37)-N6)-methyltransferase [Roseomonas sp. BN140053]|uniref:tRNA1(Val) (adenine(37)-N6)-methyltransferase n=1 Tax=Roseomonas sp. BN140053 TaxID=3391898 RepID=UPI0039ECEFC0